MKYYRAEIHSATEQMDWDSSEGAYIGYDPGTREDHGIVQTIEKDTLEALKQELHRQYDLKNAEVFEGQIEVQFEGEHDYRIPKDEQIPFAEIITIYILEVERTYIDATELLKVGVK